MDAEVGSAPRLVDGLVGKRATVMGLGTRGGGVGVARYLARAGAVVTVTDGKAAELLAAPLAELAGWPIRYQLGGHREDDFTPAGADLVVRNPGVPRSSPLLALARANGLPVEMEMSLFFRACPAPIIGVTGTKGKTTVATLCAGMLRAWEASTILAGNMGVSALDQLKEIGPKTPVVVELSSWQIEGLTEHGLSPAIAVLTMIAEDHLDAYDGFADYAATKRGITRHQVPADWLVVNADDPESWRATAETEARVVPFAAADRGGDGAWLEEGRTLLWRREGREERVVLPDRPGLLGAHNATNALAALAAARLRGADQAAVASGLRQYDGVKNRMEPVAEIAGILYINDTAATAPVAAAAAIATFAGRHRRLLLIAGGADKGLDPGPLATVAANATNLSVYLLDGTATPGLAAALRARGVEPVATFGGMMEAVAVASRDAGAGDVVLLSPGCASFGMFRDEFERGDVFRRAVANLTGAANSGAIGAGVGAGEAGR